MWSARYTQPIGEAARMRAMIGPSSRSRRARSWGAFVRADGQIVLHDRDDGSTVLVPPPVVDGREIGFADVAWAPDGERLLSLVWAVSLRATEQDPSAFLESPGMALVSLSTAGAVDVLTPWTWAFDWIDLRDVAWSATG